MVKDHFHIVLPQGYKQVLKIAAATAATSVSGLIKQAVDDYLTQRSCNDGSKTNDESS